MVIWRDNKLYKTSIIIPTYNRPRDLEKCIHSVTLQTIKPYELIIVDDGNLTQLPFKAECEDKGIQYIYFKKNIPGLAASRNLGVGLSHGDIIFFLDDDVVLTPNYIEEILKVYHIDANHSVGGVGGVIINHKPLKIRDHIRRLFEIFFLISGLSEGKVLPSGFCANFGSTGRKIRKNSQVDFLSGGVSSFRKEIFGEFRFDNERYLNYGMGEDKDFSYRVSKRYKLIVSPMAKLWHFESQQMRINSLREGKMFILDRYSFFSRYVKKGWWSKVLFSYALLGYILARIFAFIIYPNKMKAQRLIGIFSALKDILKGNIISVE